MSQKADRNRRTKQNAETKVKPLVLKEELDQMMLGKGQDEGIAFYTHEELPVKVSYAEGVLTLYHEVDEPFGTFKVAEQRKAGRPDAIISREELDQMTCVCCGGSKATEEHPLALSTRCHPGAGVQAIYVRHPKKPDDGYLRLTCWNCEASYGIELQ